MKGVVFWINAIVAAVSGVLALFFGLIVASWLMGDELSGDPRVAVGILLASIVLCLYGYMNATMVRMD